MIVTNTGITRLEFGVVRSFVFGATSTSGPGPLHSRGF